MTTSPPPYKVGFGRPPSHSQFKSGQSGNPRGRPPGSKNLQTILREELDQKVQVTENGRPKLMTKRRIAVRQQVDKAVKGDAKAFSVLVKLDIDPGGASGGDCNPGATPPSEIPAAAYDDMVSNFLDQLQGHDGGLDDGAAAPE
jgi:hypothetical protein